jgi:hypothetical protein
MSIVKLSNNGVKNATAFGSITGLGSMVFIKKLTASSSSTLSFVDGSSSVVLDNTYKEYIFTFKDIHPATNSAYLTVGFRDGGTDYDAVKTTTAFVAEHNEAGNFSGLNYGSSWDLAQSTSPQPLAPAIGNQNDECCSGTLHLFNPSSTTFVKHFISNINQYHPDDFSQNWFVAGYCNTTTAIDAVQFKMSSGNIDAGDICLYGIA